jgi:hypothetical protein
MRQLISHSVTAVAIAVFLGGCASPGPVPATPQPALSTLAQPYADGMRKVGIQSVTVYGNGARARVATRNGDIYVRYPSGLAQCAFVVYVEPNGVEADSDAFNAGNSPQYDAAIKAILPEAIRWTQANNTRVFEDNLGDGGRGR